jgi:predicted transcriptional regulator
MKPTKLEEYITILQTLLLHGPATLTEIETLVRIERDVLKKDLAFLLEQNVIVKKPSDTASTYAVSSTGARLVKYFCSNTLINRQPQ